MYIKYFLPRGFWKWFTKEVFPTPQSPNMIIFSIEKNDATERYSASTAPNSILSICDIAAILQSLFYIRCCCRSIANLPTCSHQILIHHRAWKKMEEVSLKFLKKTKKVKKFRCNIRVSDPDSTFVLFGFRNNDFWNSEILYMCRIFFSPIVIRF